MSKKNDKQDLPNNTKSFQESTKQTGALCVKCNSICSEKWAVDGRYLVCPTCLGLIQDPEEETSR